MFLLLVSVGVPVCLRGFVNYQIELKQIKLTDDVNGWRINENPIMWPNHTAIRFDN